AYGDAAVPASPDTRVVETLGADRILDFDPASGRLTCEAGLSLAEILRLFLPRGWFPPGTPGTKFVTVGGCRAADVPGNNHLPAPAAPGASSIGRGPSWPTDPRSAAAPPSSATCSLRPSAGWASRG